MLDTFPLVSQRFDLRLKYLLAAQERTSTQRLRESMEVVENHTNTWAETKAVYEPIVVGGRASMCVCLAIQHLRNVSGARNVL